MELLLDPHHVGVQLGASKLIYEPMVRLAQSVLQSCVKNNITQTDQNELPFDPRYLGLPSGTPKMISMPMVHLAQYVHLSCQD
jgi:hypothetical protein